MREDLRADGGVEWRVQALTAELCSTPADAASGAAGAVYTRWVAVLRAGGAPTRIDKVNTNASTRLDWYVHDASLDESLERRLDCG